METLPGTGCAALVMPCFDEGQRLRPDGLETLLGDPTVRLILVDDGSTDATPSVLADIASRHSQVTVLTLRRNQGKGEAVRQGLLHARAQGHGWVGYMDADLATPSEEVVRLLDIARSSSHLDVVIGSRVALLGRDVRRWPFRHYSGRVFATFASGVLHKQVYDTQCGAKVFRSTAALDRSIAQPFRSRWAFDVELLGRLALAGTASSAFWEEPLRTWHDVPGSRRGLRASLRSTADLAPIWWALQRER